MDNGMNKLKIIFMVMFNFQFAIWVFGNYLENDKPLFLISVT
jgi:hypothetical protein